MKYSILKAWLVGAVTMISIILVWFVFLQAGVFSEAALVLLWISPLLASFMTSYLSPSHKILMGTSMAFLAALLAVASNSMHQFSGTAVDFPGLKGGVVFFGLVLISSIVVSIPGSLTGYALSKKSQ